MYIGCDGTGDPVALVRAEPEMPIGDPIEYGPAPLLSCMEMNPKVSDVVLEVEDEEVCVVDVVVLLVVVELDDEE